MDIPRRYIMNMGVMDNDILHRLHQVKVTIVGVGGLGGNVANQLIRLGIINVHLVDFDVFSESNLNRQLFSDVENINQSKVDVIKNALLRINPDINITVTNQKIQDIEDIDTDYLIDCVDNVDTKLYLATLASKLNVPLLHGSCGGWYGQITWISPGSTFLHELYGTDKVGLEKSLLNPVFTPSVVASFMVSEFLKMISNNEIHYNELLLVDVLNNVLLKTGDKNG